MYSREKACMKVFSARYKRGKSVRKCVIFYTEEKKKGRMRPIVYNGEKKEIEDELFCIQ